MKAHRCSFCKIHENLNSENIFSSVGSKIMEDQSALVSENSKKTQLVTSAKAELEDVREENGRLKLVQTQIMKDCQPIQEEKTKKYEYAAASSHKQDDEEEPDQLVALSLGRSALPKSKHLKATKEEDGNCNEGLALRLDGKYDSSDNSNGVSKKDSSTKKIDELKESDQEPSDTCSPKKYSSKKARSTGDDGEEVIEQNPCKKARVSVRAICSAPTMNDGCQWRKYGQKISKGNPWPRAYYRCTVSPSCPVRKHVQRCAEDLSILVTTYEGTHNHPLPPSATAMASATSAAVTMLRSSSITSQSSGLGDTTTTDNLHGLNLINSTRPSNIPYYIPNMSSTISSTMSQLHPTITLDLTTPTASSHYNKYASTFAPPPNYSSPCLNFSAANSVSSTSLEYWGTLHSNNLNECSSYAGLTQAPSQSRSSSSFCQPYYNAINMPTNNNSYIYDQLHSRQIFTDKIAAVTKEITSNPSFQSALAVAINSIVGKRAAGAIESASNIQKVMSSSYNGSVGCATSYLNRSVVPSNSQQGNLAFSLPPLFPSSSNYLPYHPADNGEQNK